MLRLVHIALNEPYHHLKEAIASVLGNLMLGTDDEKSHVIECGGLSVIN